MIKVGIVGLGKMGLSHYALMHAHPEVEAIACDTSKYVLGVLEKNTGVSGYGDYETMLAEADLDAVVIATPSSAHAPMVRAAFEKGLHVFCEKPLTLSPEDSDELAALARERGLVTQVGYHNRFVGAFREVQALLDAGAIGEVTHVLGEAYGPVVLKPKGGTWRSKASEGGGCLYDYAAHPINLINWYCGEPTGVGGTVLPTGLLRRHRRRRLQHPLFRRRRDRPALGQLVGRVLPQDDDADDHLGHRGADLRRPPGMPGLPARHGADPRRLPAGLERPLHDRADRAGLVLPARRGVQRPGRSLRRAGSGAASPTSINGFAAAAATDRAIGMMVADARRGRLDRRPASRARRRRPRSRRRALASRRGRRDRRPA